MKVRSKIKQLTMTALFAALIAVGAFIRIPIPSVPFTLQTFFVSLAGILLGAKRGGLAAACYMVIGLVGVPIFTKGGGFSYVLEPTFGYIIGFCVGAYLTGAIAHAAGKAVPSYKRLLAASFAGVGAIYAIGMAYFWCISALYLKSGITVGTLLLYCFLQTIPGDSALCFLAAFLGVKLIPQMKKAAIIKNDGSFN